MINKNFIQDTDQLIEVCKTRGLVFLHGNVLVAKVKADRVTKGGIVLTEKAAELEDYNSGFGRIIALEKDYEGPLKLGHYILYSHEARYKPKVESLREVLGLEVIDNFLYMVQDNNAMVMIDEDIVQL